MGGQRHSKNAGTMGVEGLTYHEKKALGFGTVQQRLGKVNNKFATQSMTQLCLVANCFCFITVHSHLKLVSCRILWATTMIADSHCSLLW